MEVRFYDYGSAINIIPIRLILGQAETDAYHRPQQQLLPTTDRFYKSFGTDHSGPVALWLYPKALTWGQWGEVVEVLKFFYQKWDSVGLRFDVMDVARGEFLMANGKMKWEQLVSAD